VQFTRQQCESRPGQETDEPISRAEPVPAPDPQSLSHRQGLADRDFFSLSAGYSVGATDSPKHTEG